MSLLAPTAPQARVTRPELLNTSQAQAANRPRRGACSSILRQKLPLLADFRRDLHNFAFLGRSARIGTASDWVWYNVPHGPQKQVESFFQGQRCIREGREQVGSLPCASTP